VVLCFPPRCRDEDLAQLRAVSPAVEVLHRPFVDAVGVRNQRTQGTYRKGNNDVPPSPELVEALAEAEVVVALDLPQQMRSLAPRLRWIQAIGAGTGYLLTLDLPECVVITSAAGIGGPSIAEFVVGRLLSEWKQFDRLAELQRAHAWDSAAGQGRTFAGSNLLVVGFGAIGQGVARLARAFGVRVVALRRTPAPSPLADEVAGPDRLHELLPDADAVVVAAPATPETESLFDAAAFAAMKPGAVLVNVGRGTLIDEAAMLAALRTGRLRRAILDVTRTEPLPPDSPLWGEPGVVLSPHSSTSGDGYVENLMALFADNLGRWLRGDPLRNPVDPALGY
jgi:phosphoglycerate dehydrogenase-like enzyme